MTQKYAESCAKLSAYFSLDIDTHVAYNVGMDKKTPPNPYVQFRLREVCKSKGLSVAEICRQAEVPRSTVDSLISGHREMPSRDTLVALVHALGCEAGDLIVVSQK